VVGTRRPTYYGRDVAARLAHALAGAGVTIVSGLPAASTGILHRVVVTGLAVASIRTLG
jgi:DNA processing protein